MELGADQWRVINLPAICESQDDPLGRQLGEALWPEWEDVDALARKERSVGPREWSALYQQRPAPLEGSLFKVGQITPVDAPPLGGQVARAWDLAATTEKQGSNPDWTVGLKLARYPNGGFCIIDIYRMRGGPDEVEGAIVNLARQDGPGCRVGLPQDPGQAGKQQVLYLTRKLAGFIVESSPETGDKGTRAAPVASQVNVGNFSIVKAPWNRQFLDELASFPAGAHDDQVDALSRAFAMVGNALVMKIDPKAVSRPCGDEARQERSPPAPRKAQEPQSHPGGAEGP